jgi:hypothetical protein
MNAELLRTLRGTRFVRPLSARPFRSVEAQHLLSTRKLVDSDDEQRVLEQLIDAKKPPRPDDGPHGLHYLFATPFRYPPLRHGSRFGTRLERGIWYGSLDRRTVLAETAYYRLLFVEGSSAVLTPLELEFTIFRARVKTTRGARLTAPPFAAHENEISSKTSYDTSQAVGRALREANVEAFEYQSARDAEGGTNLGVFTPRAFSERRPSSLESFLCRVERTHVEFAQKTHFERKVMRFSRNQFLVRGRLPAPGV